MLSSMRIACEIDNRSTVICQTCQHGKDGRERGAEATAASPTSPLFGFASPAGAGPPGQRRGVEDRTRCSAHASARAGRKPIAKDRIESVAAQRRGGPPAQHLVQDLVRHHILGRGQVRSARL